MNIHKSRLSLIVRNLPPSERLQDAAPNNEITSNNEAGRLITQTLVPNQD
jgi:hypothetical protein